MRSGSADRRKARAIGALGWPAAARGDRASDRHGSAIILADEPTGNLDTASTREVLEIFTGLNAAGRTIVMITHEHDVAAHAKRVDPVCATAESSPTCARRRVAGAAAASRSGLARARSGGARMSVFEALTDGRPRSAGEPPAFVPDAARHLDRRRIGDRPGRRRPRLGVAVRSRSRVSARTRSRFSPAASASAGASARARARSRS